MAGGPWSAGAQSRVMNDSPSTPTWHVLGAGSMGSLASWRLQQAGLRTCMAGGTAASRTLIWPDHRSQTLALAADDQGPIHALLLAVKAGDTQVALQPLLPRLADNALLLRLQNGMGTLDGLPLPANLRIIDAVTTDGAWRQDDCIHVVAENITWAGDGQSLPPPDLARLADHWPGWRWCADIEQRQWQKLVINALINPLTAIYRCRNGELLDQGPRQDAMAALARELDTLLPRWLPDWPGGSLALATDVAAQTAANTSSMLADVLAGKPTEVDYINGHVVRMATRLGLSAPANEAMVARIHQLTD